MQHLQIVAHQACGYVDDPPTWTEKHPAAAKSEGLRHDARMGGEIGHLRRRPATGEVAGRRAEDELLARQEPAGKGRIGKGTESDDEVERLGDDVGALSGEGHLQSQVGKRLEKLRQKRGDARARVGRRRGEMECPAHLSTRPHDCGVGFACQSDQRGAALEVGPPGRRQPGLAGGTLEQPRSQTCLERRKPPAHGRLGSREAVRRRGEASRLDDCDEHLDVLDARHEGSIHTPSV